MNERVRIARLGATALLVAGAVAFSACENPGSPGQGSADLRLELQNVPPAASAVMEGYEYEAWVVDDGDAIHSAGRFDPGASGSATVESPIPDPAHVMVTVELAAEEPGGRPAAEKLIGGRFQPTGRADLTIDRYLTAGVPLVEEPGSHVLFTPSDNPELDFPSNEDAGIWLFRIEPEVRDRQEDYFLRMGTLSDGWTYEGWIVRDHGTEDACWLSYGKFEPDVNGRLSGRDDLGLGPYSGRLDYVRSLPQEIDMPGGDFVSNPHGYPLPCGLELPLDLNGDKQAGVESRWTHVITMEPARHEEHEEVPSAHEMENPLEREPFFLRPYSNPIGEGAVAEPREIRFHPEDLPGGRATLETSSGS